MTHRPLGAQISHMLKARGVDVIFGIPGVHNQELYRGIEEAGIAHVLARHEQGAGFMADGYARATGRPGVCYVISGPGLTNIMTPMGQAYSDSVPMLVISACLDETAARKGQLHQMKDQRAAAETVCDWSEAARTAAAAYQLIDRALVEFGSGGRPRPKHVQVPIHVLEAAVAPAPGLPGFGGPREVNRGDVDHVIGMVRKARRPLVVFGGGAASSVDNTLAQTFAGQIGAGVFTTYAGRGTVAPAYPLFFGSTLARGSSEQVFAHADLVIAIGTELAEVDLWRDQLGHSCPLVRVDVDSDASMDAHPGDVLVRSDAGRFIDAFVPGFDGPQETDWRPQDAAAFRSKARAEVDAEYPGVCRVADALKPCLPDGSMIYSDMTQFAYAAKEVWDMDRPGHWHHPYGFGTLGYALPAAIGGAVARPGLPTLAIAGDYGFQYTVNELATAVELGLPLPIFLWDNGKLGAIEASMTSAQIAPNAVIARNPDFGKLADAYGAGYAAPGTLGEMQGAVRAALAADRPTLIRVTPQIGD